MNMANRALSRTDMKYVLDRSEGRAALQESNDANMHLNIPWVDGLG